MEQILFVDTVRFVHIFAVCAGLGTSILADMHAARAIKERVDASLLETLHFFHRVVVISLVVMWITGLALIGIRTGFDISQMTPKLTAKVLTVSLLTVNAVIIARVAMPVMRRAVGTTLADLPRVTFTLLGLIGAVSTASWCLALALGVSKVLAVSPATVFVYLLPMVYGAAALGSLWLMRRLRGWGAVAV